MNTRFLRFCTVGAAGLAVETVVFALLQVIPGVPAMAAKALAIEIAILNNFGLNRRWTFRNCPTRINGRGGWLDGCGRYHLACLVGAVMNLGLFGGFKAGGLPTYTAHFMAVVLTAVLNYWLCRKIVWNTGVPAVAGPPIGGGAEGKTVGDGYLPPARPLVLFRTENFNTVYGVIISWKLVTLCTWLLLVAVRPELSSPNRSQREMEIVGVPATSLIAAWMPWDGAAYQHLALHWYSRGETAAERAYHAHYPLLPALLRCAFLLGGSPLLTSVIVCQVVGVLALLALYEAWKVTFGPAHSVRALWLFCAYPWSMFLEQVYTEGLAVLLLSLLVLAMNRRRLLLACTCALLLPSARPTGHLVTASLLACLVFSGDFKKWLWPALAGVAGSCFYLLVMYLSTGDAFSGFTAQQYYPAKGSVLYLVDPAKVFTGFMNFAPSHYMHRSPLDRLLFLGFLIEAWFIATRCRDSFVRWFTLAAGFVPAITNLFFSFARFHLLCLISLPWVICREPAGKTGGFRELVILGFIFKAALLWRHWIFLWAG